MGRLLEAGRGRNAKGCCSASEREMEFRAWLILVMMDMDKSFLRLNGQPPNDNIDSYFVAKLKGKGDWVAELIGILSAVPDNCWLTMSVCVVFSVVTAPASLMSLKGLTSSNMGEIP